MKNRRIAIIVCAFLIIAILPIAGSSSQPERTTFLRTKVAGLEGATLPTTPPGPRESVNPSRISEGGKTTATPHPFRDASMLQTSDFIISLMQQVNHSLFFNYLQNLTGFGPRLTGSPACEAAASYIYTQFKDMGLTVRYDNWSQSGYSASNIEATLPGSDPNISDIFLICGHYDSVAVSPGADDDGSGTVATIIAASIMSKHTFNATIRFVTFSGEEQGLLGSAAYAAEASTNGDNIIGVLNADMISYAVTAGDGNHLKIYENTPSEWMYNFTVSVEQLYHQYINLTLIHSGYIWGSDHNSFWNEGYNAIFTFEYTETPYYHTSGDTIAHMNVSYGVKITKLLVATLAELTAPSGVSNPPQTPTITGPTLGGIDASYVYEVVTTDPDGDPVSYFVDWGDTTSSGWFGPFSSGAPATASHAWTSPGTYLVQARARDIFHATSNWSVPLTVVILNDHPPSSPTLTGETHGHKGIPYFYKVLATDPDGDDISYYIDWGDNSSSGWLGPYASGAQVTAHHRWTTEGSYAIRAKVKDATGLESAWATLPISMPALLQQSSQLTFDQITTDLSYTVMQSDGNLKK
jgi:hypothetical protein